MLGVHAEPGGKLALRGRHRRRGIGCPHPDRIGDVVPGILAALARETHPGPFAEMLITLGSSGAREAWPILRAHLAAEDGDVRDAAEEGIESWHLRNGLSPASAAPPYPPAPLPHSPASQGLDQWLGYAPTPPGTPCSSEAVRRSSAAA
jgi:hypothetical protein